jgi:hypothetical protein
VFLDFTTQYAEMFDLHPTSQRNDHVIFRESQGFSASLGLGFSIPRKYKK